MTKQRQAILTALQDSPGHLTAEEVFMIVRHTLPGIALATVYNNLNALAKDGTIRRVPVCRGSDRYDKTSTPHEHLICENCGSMSDLDTGDLIRELEKRNHLHISSLEMNAYYLCPSCRHASAAD